MKALLNGRSSRYWIVDDVSSPFIDSWSEVDGFIPSLSVADYYVFSEGEVSGVLDIDSGVQSGWRLIPEISVLKESEKRFVLENNRASNIVMFLDSVAGDSGLLNDYPVLRARFEGYTYDVVSRVFPVKFFSRFA